MRTDLTVRLATPADVDRISEVHTQARTAYYLAGGLSPEVLADPVAARARRDSWAECIAAPATSVVCAVVDSDVVGVAGMGPPMERATAPEVAGELYHIHVHPRYWSRGVGRALHAAFVNHLDRVGLTTGVLEVWERNSRARAFYATLGWLPDGRTRPGPDGSQFLSLRLDLTRR